MSSITDAPLSFVIHMLIRVEVHWHPVMLQLLSRIIIHVVTVRGLIGYVCHYIYKPSVSNLSTIKRLLKIVAKQNIEPKDFLTFKKKIIHTSIILWIFPINCRLLLPCTYNYLTSSGDDVPFINKGFFGIYKLVLIIPIGIKNSKINSQ